MAITINGTTGIAGVDGTAATPAVQGADTNTGVFYPAADTVGVSTGGSERMRVDSSGNVGIGGTPSGSYKLQVIGTAASTFSAFGVTGTTTSPAFAQFVNTGCTTIFGVEGSVPATLCTGTLAYASIFGNSSTASVQFITANSVRTTIDSSGNLLVGTTTQVGTEQLGIVFSDPSGKGGLGVQVVSNATGAVFAAFRNSAGTLIGSVSRNTTTNAVLYNTTSDYRLKENVKPLTNALGRVATLKPVQWVWKDCDGAVGEGFIAHEVQDVVPAAVSGKKDAVDAEGNIKPQGMDSSYLVATLTAAIQEQQALITQLQADVAALKGKT